MRSGGQLQQSGRRLHHMCCVRRLAVLLYGYVLRGNRRGASQRGPRGSATTSGCLSDARHGGNVEHAADDDQPAGNLSSCLPLRAALSHDQPFEQNRQRM